jgi:integrase
MLSFGQEIGYLAFNVGAAVKLRPNRDSLAQRILEESQVAKLIDAAPEGRDRVLLKLLYVSGVRVSELCGLKWCDAVPRQEGGQVTVFGKRGKTRSILLKPKSWAQLLAIRGAAGPVDPVFRSRKGGAPHCVCRDEEGRSRAKGLAPLDAPRPREPCTRPQRSDPPRSGDARSRLGFNDRPISPRAPNG